MSETHERIAIVTGSTSGIGEAIVKKFAAAGFGIVGNGRNTDKLAALEQQIGPSFCGVAGDAADNTVIESLFTAAKDHFGKKVDLVVANAGRGLGGSVKDADLSQFEALLNVNVTGTLKLIQKAVQEMLDTQEKSFPETAADIVLIGSVVGRHISPFSAVYGATKFAVHALAESLRREVSPKGIRVSLVEPGFVASGFQAVAGYSESMVKTISNSFGPVLAPEDVANTVQYIVTQPAHIHICDIVVRPTRQDYP